MDRNMTLRLRIFEFLATPGHAWLKVVAWLCGMTFEFGPVHGPDDPLD